MDPIAFSPAGDLAELDERDQELLDMDSVCLLRSNLYCSLVSVALESNSCKDFHPVHIAGITS